MFRRFKDGQSVTAKQFIRMIHEKPTKGQLIAWYRRNFPQESKQIEKELHK